MAEDATYLLKSEGLPDGALTVIRFEGEEAISAPFEMRVQALADSPSIEGSDVLGQPATLDLGESTFSGPRRFHGVIAGFAFTGTTPDGRFLYDAVLRPRLWLLSRTKRNRIFATEEAMTVQQIVTKVLEDDLGLASDDHEWRLTAEYPPREHVVQYAESDLDFVSRLLEHWGIAYFLEHRGPRDRIVFTDSNVGFFTEASYDGDDATGDEHVAPFRPGAGMAASDDPAVYSLACRQGLKLRQATIKDYNYRLSHVSLHGQSPVVDAGVGTHAGYGDHFKLPEEGVALSRTRLEEANCRSLVIEGTSNMKALRAGLLFPVSGHMHPRCNGRHLFVVIRHEGGDKVAGVSGLGGDESRATSYRNSFEAIPGDTPFRPARVTPKPRIDGVMNAFVDAAGGGERAEIDEHGRYRVIIPFDVAGKPAAKASRWLRMAQPYGGAGHGFHFPLLKGTEVLLTFVDGDPDRPIISGVVANPQHPSVVTGRNAYRNVLRSVSGVEMEFNDGPAGRAIHAAATGGGLAAQQHGESPLALAARQHGESPFVLDAQPQAEGEDTPEGADPSDFSESDEEEEKWARITVPHYEEENTSYLRLGSPDTAWETSTNLPGTKGFMSYDEEKKEAGWLDYTDGGRFTYTKGNYESLIDGESIERITKSGEDIKYTSVRKGLLGWHEIEAGFVSSSEYSYGHKEEYFAGYTFEAAAALSFEIFIGFKLEITGASVTEVNLGTKTEANAQIVFEYNKAEHYSIAKEREIFAAEKIVLSVDHAAHEAADIPFKLIPVGTGVLAAAAGGIIGGIVGGTISTDQKGHIADGILTGAGMGIAAGATLVATTVAAIAAYKAHGLGHAVNLTAPAIEIGQHDITLKVGTSSIKIDGTGITMQAGTTTSIKMTSTKIDLGWTNVSGNSGYISCANLLEMSGPRIAIGSDTTIKIDADASTELSIGGTKTLATSAASTNVYGANNFGD